MVAREERGIEAIHGLEDIDGGGMAVVLQKKDHDGVTLSGAPEAAVFEGLPDLVCNQHEIRLYLK